MDLRIQIKEAIRNLAAFKMRAALAILGILVGTASVVAMVSGGELATRQALQQFKNLGTDVLAVSINKNFSKDPDNDNNSKISVQTALNVKTASQTILDAAPYTSVYAAITFEGHKIDAVTLGATENLAAIMQLILHKGRFVSYLDKYAFYCVLGDNVYQKIKRYDKNPIGKQVKIGPDYFTIIGIINPSSTNTTFVYANLNNSIFVPLQTTTIINKYSDIYNLIVKVKPDTNIDQVEEKIKHYFKKNAPNRKLFIRSARQFIASMTKQKEILTIFLGLVGGIALIVGGIGVMNIMLVSVTERKREIGIRLAVGAKRRDIQTLFLVEAVSLSLIGGILGVIIGILISYIIATVKHWGFILFFDPPLVGFTVSVIIGIFFGYYPAHKASKLDPIETLRAE